MSSSILRLSLPDLFKGNTLNIFSSFLSYQIWRSESEILVFLIVAWSAWFRWIPWISILLTLLTWLASVPNEGQQILFKGRILLIGPVIKKSVSV